MLRLNLDLEFFARQSRAKAATLSSDRQRRMIEVYIEHGIAETAGELDRLMATMSEDVAFHIWIAGQDIGPKGRDAVRDMYRHMFEVTHMHYFEMDIQRMTIDDDAIVKEFTQRRIFPGFNLQSGPFADALRARGEEPDLAGHYFSEGRLIVTLPFNAACEMLGEDAYTAGSPKLRKLGAGELPLAYLDRLKRAGIAVSQA
jgi:hypothetical protein